MTKPTLEKCLLTKIKRSRKTVFLRSDFRKLGGYDQVGRALNKLAQQGELIRVGYGLYTKARANRLTGKPMVAAPGGFSEVCRAGLRRLKVDWEYNAATKAYLNNQSQQIPADFQPIIKVRFSRKISYNNQELKCLRRL